MFGSLNVGLQRVVAYRDTSKMSGQLKSGGLQEPMQAEAAKKIRKSTMDADARTPLYRKISHSLLAGIREGKFPVGSFLPGELELIDRFDASRHTIREALRVLEDMGLVKRQRGRGTLVLSTEAAPAFVQMVRSPSELFSYPDSSQFRLLTDGLIKADKSLARELGCQVGDEWVEISGLRTLGSDGMPICWANVYVIPEYGSISQRLGGSSRPVYEMIAETFKESIENITVRLTAGVLSAQKAETLGVDEGTPSLSVSRFYQGRGGRVFEVSMSEHPASNFSYTFEFTRGWQTADHWSWSN
ncbi:MAG: hypothetical protein CME57_00290 [Halieaceae bacterium]|nr:hypothetical protein [Halieaceae bacterium]